MYEYSGNHGAGVPVDREDGAHSAPKSGPVGRVKSVSAASVEIMLDPSAPLAKDCRISSVLRISSGASNVYATVRLIEGQGADTVLTADFIGEAGDLNASGRNSLSRGVSTYPPPSSPAWLLDEEEMAPLFEPKDDSIAVRVGTVYPTSVPAMVHVDNLLSKHFAVLGSTGTGKSSTVALIIHRIVEAMPDGHILILDPHNEYAAAFRETGVHFDPTTLSLPYWMMNFEEHVEVFIGQREASREVEVDVLKRSLLNARKKNARFSVSKITVDTPTPYKLSDLIADLEQQMGKLEKPETLLPFLRLKHKIEELRGDERYGFMFSGMLINDTFSDIIGRLLRMPSNKKPVSTLDLSGVPSDIVDVVVSVLCRMVFDFALWSRKGDAARPLLLVCEEAHRYVPRQHNPRFDSARRTIDRIAKEGRKYGVSLGLVSQRPSDISESILSQCGTIVAMRMNNERDAAFVASALPEGSEAFLASISSLKNRECVLCGEGVSVPMRVKLDTLDEALRPSSEDPAFSRNWRLGDQNPGFVQSVVTRWRAGNR